MRPKSGRELLKIGEDLPKITAGAFLPDEQMLITGHETGILLKWDLATKKYSVIRQCESPIQTISVSSRKDIAVGCHSGLLVVFSVKMPEKAEIVQEAGSSVFSRIWKCTWASEDVLVTASTYGKMTSWRKLHDKWEFSLLQGHTDSIFGLASSGGLIASGDYRGNILVWGRKKDSFNEIDRLQTFGTIEGAAWGSDASFATISQSGRICFFERSEQEEKWKSVYEIEAATSVGNCIHITDDGKAVFAGTNSEIIQFDVQTQEVQQLPSIAPVRALFSNDANVFVLTESNFEVFDRSEVEVPISHVRYQYAKVSLIGHTGVGKTTFCNDIVGNSTHEIKSTIGKRIWTWTLESPTPQRRLVFHDHGGQETVLGTFLPFLADSDLILVFFQQNDIVTLERASTIIDEMQSVIGEKAKIFLIRTYIDQISEVSDSAVEELTQKPHVVGILPVCPRSGDGIQETKKQLVHAIAWKNAKTVIQSDSVDTLSNLIAELVGQNKPLVSFQEVKLLYEKKSGATIATGHLRFLLRNYSDQGQIEYYPSILDQVIINDDRYNALRSEIPFYVNDRKGIVAIEDLLKKFKPRQYVEILDQVYLGIGVSIKNRNLRIFPGNLREGKAKIPSDLQKLVAKSHKHVERFLEQRVRTGPLIAALSELNMGCVDASKAEGVFTWERNACVYYLIHEFGDEVRGRGIEIVYYIGGQREQITQRLESEFKAIIEHLYGGALETGKSENGDF